MQSGLVKVCLACVLGYVCFAPALGQTAKKSQKYALLMAVTKYEHAEMNKPKLEFPEEDARALGALLKDSGYEVDFLLGSAATREAIKQKLEALNTKGSADGVVLVGLFGHGVEIETRGSD